jgi:hypothetical protein
MKVLEKNIKNMFDLDSLKIYSINAIAFLSTFTTIDTILKLSLLVASIIYTVVKIMAVIKNDLNIKDTVEEMKENVDVLKEVKKEIVEKIKEDKE